MFMQIWTCPGKDHARVTLLQTEKTTADSSANEVAALPSPFL